MVQVRSFAVVLLLFASAALARADGKFYAKERVPPGVPYQRALLMFDDGKETLVLQSKFSAAGNPAPDAALGWVVPAPGVPELDSMKSKEALEVFWLLSHLSGSVVTLIPLSLIISLVAVVSFIVLCFVKKVRTLYLLCGIFCWLVLVTFLIPTLLLRAKMTAGGVDVIHEQDVGIYHAKVIKAADSSGLIAWLNEGGFRFQSSDQPVLDDYIKRGWVFVVAKVKPNEKAKGLVAYEGLPDPLILRFESKIPVYPLALTGTAGTPTEVLLYVLGKRKMSCGSALELKFAGPIDEVPQGLSYKPWESALTYLCKFKGTLTPAQMRKDLELEPAADDAPYRERRVIWR
jgi:hypothetical protein